MASTFIRHSECPKCGSKNNLAVYSDHSICFTDGCDYYEGNKTKERPIENETKKPLTALPRKEMPGIQHRGIDKATVSKYQVTVSQNPDGPGEAIFPRFKEGEHVANQVRLKNKEFRVEGTIKGAELFGQSAFQAGGKYLTITEGYYDTLAAYQITGSRYPNVGVMSASSAKREIIDNFEWVNSFEEIIINFDSDDPGQKAAKDVAHLFEPGKVRLLCLEKAKDSNDYLMKGLDKDYVNEWWRAAPFMPDGLKLGTELWGDIINHKIPHSVPYPWKILNNQTYGIRRSEVVLLTAETGVGKTSIVKAIEHNLLKNEELIAEGAGVGLLHLEEPKYDTAIGLMSIEAQMPFHLPDTIKSEEELRTAYDAVINSNRLVIWDHFGSNDIEVVLAKIRHMAALGCKYIVVDHLSIIVSDQSGDERKQLDEISTKLKTLCMNLNIACICVIHLNRQGEIRGSAGPEQIANIVIRLERDKKESNSWRRNITKLTVEKNRFCGRTGPSSYLFYNEDTGCLEELTQEQIINFENGGTGAGHEFSEMD
jgi:twinkle protein